MDKVKTYKIKLTKTDHIKMEKTLRKSSKVYNWLREKYSKNKIRVELNLRWSSIYQTFLDPRYNITLDRLASIKELLPEKSLPEILDGLVPDHSREWWELEDYEENILLSKLKK